ncbi:MAG: integration host factor subunit beta [Kiritimatiellaeota bacterium]|nr:integration host factor subunit beta [Kiritimatiellota bacterium]
MSLLTKKSPADTYTGAALTKRDLAATVAEKSGLNQFQALQAVQSALDGILDALAKGQHVEFREFGVFNIVTRKARVGRNPNKPQDTFEIPAHRYVKFKPGKRMRERVKDCF